MKKILIVRFDRMSNEEHFEFGVVVYNLMDGYEAVKILLADDLPALNLLLELERAAVDAPHGSPLTAKIKVADKVLDKQLGLMLTAIDVAKFSPDPVLVQAADDLQFALKPYGYIQGKKYEAEVGAAKSLLFDLRGKYLPQATTVGIAQWFDPLQAALDTEVALFAQRNAENAQRTQQEKMKDIRPKVEELVHRMERHVEVAAEKSDAYNTFIAELNEKIRYENERHQPRKTDIAEAIVDSIPDQTLDETGYATPLCNVSIKDLSSGNLKKLVFTKDYTTAYRLNNKVGNAELVVRGKGEYRGVKGVTFRIVNSEELS
jgi:hypothetical protein